MASTKQLKQSSSVALFPRADRSPCPSRTGPRYFCVTYVFPPFLFVSLFWFLSCVFFCDAFVILLRYVFGRFLLWFAFFLDTRTHLIVFAFAVHPHPYAPTPKVPDVRFYKQTGDINKIPWSGLFGTGGYIAPEIMRQEPFGKPADLW